MSDLNRVVVTGRLTRDAEKKTTASGMAVVRFSLANGYRKKDGDQWKDETNYFDCVFIGSRADSLLQYLKKGRQVAIDGELRQSRWEKDGQNYSKSGLFLICQRPAREAGCTECRNHVL